MSDNEKAKLLAYIYYVDKYGDSITETIGSFVVLLGGCIGILAGGPYGLAFGVATIATAIIENNSIDDDKKLCIDYAHKIADEIIN